MCCCLYIDIDISFVLLSHSDTGINNDYHEDVWEGMEGAKAGDNLTFVFNPNAGSLGKWQYVKSSTTT